ncbi:MAG: ribonuclease R [Thiotrichaceae bacterium]|nr:MAG: ribonuclease R [Thiotrichaceae bacterium]
MLKKIKKKIKSILAKKSKKKVDENPIPKQVPRKKRAAKNSTTDKHNTKKKVVKKKSSKNPTPKKRTSKKQGSKNTASDNSEGKKRPSKKAFFKRSRKLKDPEAKQEAKKYDNPVASRTLLLETIKEEGTMTQSSVFKALDVREDQEEGVSRRLSAMVRDGQLVRNRRGGYLPVDENHLIKGHVIAHADGFGFLVPDEGGNDLFLSAKQMRGVLHGDHAVATVAGVDRRGRREGSIISVVERANSTLVGRLFNDDGIAYVVPDNKRITQNIMIPADMLADSAVGQIVKVEITSQPTNRKQMVGRVIDVIGEHMAPGMEIEMAIHNHGIPYEFPDTVTAQANNFGESVKDKDKQGRLDLRDLPLVTIDGADARDFDDAVYSEPAKNGWRLLVAIADVAHYVDIGSPLDVEGYERATSVYFPGRVLPMLPEALSNGLCSINPDVDRLCMVCEMFINKQGEIESYDFKEGVMRSHARLTYTQVAEALEGEGTGEIAANIYPHIVNLNEMYQALDGARTARGTIEFDTTETVINFTSDKRIESIRPSTRNDAHKIIEECMISANVCAAKFIAKNKIPCLYRVHEDPTDEKIQDLRGFLSDLDLTLGEASRKIVSSDYAALSAEIKQRDDFYMIQTLMLRSMKQAVYMPENSGHFGLALTHYAHFTSPIRRYPDLLVHRALKHIVRKRPKSDYTYSPQRMAQMGEHCSDNERRANEATRDAEFALKCEYMLDKIGNSYDAHVTGVVQFGLFVELSEHFVEGLIHITNLPKDYYVFDPKTHQLVGENRGITFGLNDKIRIKVSRVDMDERKIDFELISEH